MKRITATLFVFTALTALSTAAMAETPTQRNLHSWDYVQQVAYPPAAAEAPASEHHEARPYYHHEEKGGKHHHKHHHDGKKAGHAHHHHHHKAKDEGKDAPAKEQPKQ